MSLAIASWVSRDWRMIKTEFGMMTVSGTPTLVFGVESEGLALTNSDLEATVRIVPLASGRVADLHVSG